VRFVTDVEASRSQDPPGRRRARDVVVGVAPRPVRSARGLHGPTFEDAEEAA
jgi:hypothetical protein